MTRNNETSYREQGRAVFLAATMVLSVVAISAAFAGGAAATAPTDIDDVDKLGDELRYQGQSFDVNVSKFSNPGSEVYLVRYTDIGDSEFQVVSPYAVNGDIAEDVETADLDPSETFGISNSSTQSNVELRGNFSVVEQSLDATWDSDSATNRDSDVRVELDTQRTGTNYNVTVSAEDMSYAQLKDLFAEGTSATVVEPISGSSDTASLSESNAPDIPVDKLGFDRDDDEFGDIKDAGYLTINLSSSSTFGSDSELEADFSYLDDNEGLPESGEYNFEFQIADTTASASDSIQISEASEDGDFSAGTYEATAGDIAEFEFEVEDTDGTYVQIGGPDVDFAEVLYINADDTSEPVSVKVNTRLLGTDPSISTDTVYDYENTDSFNSAYHGTGFSFTRGGVDVFGSDGPEGGAAGAPAYNYTDYLDELGIISSNNKEDQLVRPLQSTQYDITLAGYQTLDGASDAVFDADADGAANNQLDSSVLLLEQPEIGDITVHTAPEEAADDTADVEELVSAATPSNEVAIDDRLIVQFEATGMYGGIVAGAEDGGTLNNDWDRLEDGVSSSTVYDFVDTTNETISLSIEAQSASGNANPLNIDLEGTNSGDSDTYVVIDNDGGQFFVVADTSSDDAFENGDAPSSATSFTASLEYDADESDNRYAFEGDNPANGAFSADDADDNYPYLLQGETLSSSSELELAPRSITFDNLNEGGVIQAQASEESEISGTTNVAPGSDAELRISSTAASSSFRQGNDINISEDGSVTTTYDLSGQEVGDEFTADFRVGGSSVASNDGIVVEAIGTGDDEETNETTDDGETNETTDDGMTDDGETNETTDDGGDDGSTDDGTPGFGAVVALIALIGAALLAVRRQN